MAELSEVEIEALKTEVANAAIGLVDSYEGRIACEEDRRAICMGLGVAACETMLRSFVGTADLDDMLQVWMALFLQAYNRAIKLREERQTIAS